MVHGDDLAEIDVGQDVTRDHKERVLEEVCRVADRSGGAERLALDDVFDRHAVVAAVSEVLTDRVWHERQGHDDVCDAVAAEQIDDVFHHRAIGDGEERFGLVGRQGPESAALAAGHDHCLHVGASEAAAALLRPDRPARSASRAAGTYPNAE